MSDATNDLRKEIRHKEIPFVADRAGDHRGQPRFLPRLVQRVGSREAVSHKVDVNLTVNTDKVKADAKAVKAKATELTGKKTEDVSESDNLTKDKVKSIDP